MTGVRAVRFAHMSVGAVMPTEAIASPVPIDREWAWGKATGAGVRVCIIDSGIDLPGADIARYAVFEDGSDWHIGPDDEGDLAGHGTACAGIIRALAPDCELTSLRVLSRNLRATGDALMIAAEWAVRQRFHLVNVSLSTRKDEYKERLHDITDRAWFAGVTFVAAAHNGPFDSFPWRFPSVISVGAHDQDDPEHLESNPEPPVDFFARGSSVPVTWSGGRTKLVSGNSFAAPHVVGLCARVVECHPAFRTPQLRHVLTSIANNHTSNSRTAHA